MDDTGACQRARKSDTDVALRGSDGIPVKSHQVNSSDILDSQEHSSYRISDSRPVKFFKSLEPLIIFFKPSSQRQTGKRGFRPLSIRLGNFGPVLGVQQQCLIKCTPFFRRVIPAQKFSKKVSERFCKISMIRGLSAKPLLPVQQQRVER